MIIAPLDAAVAEAIQKISRVAVPDMPDRIIAATAVHLNAELVTRDRRLQAALGNRSIW
jgi:predicted nucleic acid-binding protein